MAPIAPALLDTEQAAAHLNMQPQTLRVWRTQGKGPRFVRIGRHVRYQMGQLDAFIEAQTVDPAAA